MTQPERRGLYAGIVSRLLALVIDAVILGVAAIAVGLGGPALWSAVAGSAPHWLTAGAGVVAGLLPFLYFWLCWWLGGQTAGSVMVGMVVRRADGSRVGAFRAAARAFLGLAFAPVWLVGLLVTVVNPRRRALHDLLLGTVVRRT